MITTKTSPCGIFHLNCLVLKEFVEGQQEKGQDSQGKTRNRKIWENLIIPGPKIRPNLQRSDNIKVFKPHRKYTEVGVRKMDKCRSAAEGRSMPKALVKL